MLDGRLSASNVELLRLATRLVTALFVRVEQEGGRSCALDVTLAYEVFSEHKAMMLYPINALRNLARLQV
jgi:hypothetical protein